VLSAKDVRDRLPDIVDGLFRNIPSGLGSRRKDLKLSHGELKAVLQKGARWATAHGFGTSSDLENIENQGCLDDADPDAVSEKAYERGKDQLGTVGSGNHFVEVGYIAEVFDENAARAFGLFRDQATIMIHTGSRGLGYQVCDESIRQMLKAAEKYGITLADRQLCCAPFNSTEGRRYFSAMAAAANYAFAKRQMITQFEAALAKKGLPFQLFQIYDIAHNMAKIETHRIAGQEMQVCVHRKGATRAFGPGHLELPEEYRPLGQPVLVPGSMGTASWVLVGTAESMQRSFGSSCHGAGRVMSRSQAKKEVRGEALRRDLEAEGIHIRAGSLPGLAEEAPQAYKDVDDVVAVVSGAGIARKVVRLRPVAVIKG